MMPDPLFPERLLSVPTEAEATAIVTALGEYGVEAITAGGYTAGFKVAAPANVAVLVKQADLDRARRALEEIRSDGDRVDWSNAIAAELPESPEPDVDAEAATRPPSVWRPRTDHIVLALVLSIGAVGLLIWLLGILPRQ